jgi:hypothetical protein
LELPHETEGAEGRKDSFIVCHSENVWRDECWKNRKETEIKRRGCKNLRWQIVLAAVRLMLHDVVRKVAILFHLDKTVVMNVILLT